jgi:hypothetical protein
MNIPIKIENKNILFAGIGGGFDIFGAIPLLSSLKNNNHVFSNYNGEADKFTDMPNCYPENLLELKPLYVLPKMGVKAYLDMYKSIVAKHNIDVIIAVDGGVDSLMHGDEEGAGTILEDFANLIALNQLSSVDKYLVCSGFGTELEEGVCHHRVLENISLLCKDGGFLGSCSLVQGPEFDEYKRICERVWENNRKSHVQTKVIASVLGDFGKANLYEDSEAKIINSTKNIFLSPLMGIYWFFKLSNVMKYNRLYGSLSQTTTKTDLFMVYRQMIDNLKPMRKNVVFPY